MTASVTQPGTATVLDEDAAAQLAAHARAAFDAGDLPAARAAFEALLADNPAHPALHDMLGRIAKYQRDWVASRHHALLALSLHEDPADAAAAHWNAAIAATALGEHHEARRHWSACGIELPSSDGAIERAFGVACLRLDAWGRDETVFARRLDPVRASLIHVPSPDSGYRYGDVVLHDATPTGERRFHQSRVPVYNVLQRLELSEFRTFAVSVRCKERAAIDALCDLRVPGIASVDDWTDGMPRGRLGVAAQSRASVQRLLDRWKADGPGRWLDALESRDATPSEPPASGACWWLSPEDRGGG
jgi:tetratricopeptide (TPR) repeat protein